MEAIRVSGVLHEKISKSGNTYVALDVNLTPTYIKTFFVEPADVECIKLWLENEKLKNDKKDILEN